MNAMIRKTVYEGLFDMLAEDPRITDARPCDGRKGVKVAFGLEPGQGPSWHYKGTAKPTPDGRYLWTAGIYGTSDAADIMPATFAPQILDKLDADHLHKAIAAGLGHGVMENDWRER